MDKHSCFRPLFLLLVLVLALADHRYFSSIQQRGEMGTRISP